MLNANIHPIMIPIYIALTISTLFAEPVSLIKQLDEITPVLNRVEMEGGFTVEPSQYWAPFAAFWNGKQRKILVNLRENTNLPSRISAILFELHNAYRDRELNAIFDQAYAGKISRESFIQQVEHIEWKNWEESCVLLNLGVQRGIFPPGTEKQFVPFKSFQQYLDKQRVEGHCAYIGEMFDQIVRFN